MKTRIIILTLLMSLTAQASVFQRSVQSNYRAYKAYIQNVGGGEFKDLYFHQTALRLPKSDSLDHCLDAISRKEFSIKFCEASVKELTQVPTNSEARLLLLDLLKYFPKNNSFYQNYRRGLSRSANQTSSSLLNNALIKKAFDAILNSMKTKDDYLLLVDGQPIENLTEWEDDNQIHQFSLITNSYHPLIRLTKWSVFLSLIKNESLPFSSTCPDSNDLHLTNYGFEDLGLYHSQNCIARTALEPVTHEEHLRSAHLSKMESKGESSVQKNTKWIYMATLVIIGGLAYGLKDKNVSIELPSLR